MPLGPSDAEGSWPLEHRVWVWTAPHLEVVQSSWKGNQRNAMVVIAEGTGSQEKIKTFLINLCLVGCSEHLSKK